MSLDANVKKCTLAPVSRVLVRKDVKQIQTKMHSSLSPAYVRVNAVRRWLQTYTLTLRHGANNIGAWYVRQLPLEAETSRRIQKRGRQIVYRAFGWAGCHSRAICNVGCRGSVGIAIFGSLNWFIELNEIQFLKILTIEIFNMQC